MVNSPIQGPQTPTKDICRRRFSLLSFAILLGTLAFSELFSSKSISSKLKSYLTVQDVSAIRRENATTSWNGDGWEQTRISESSVKRISEELDGTILFREDFGADSGNSVYDSANGYDFSKGRSNHTDDDDAADHDGNNNYDNGSEDDDDVTNLNNETNFTNYKNGGIPPHIEEAISINRNNYNANPNLPSPACHPHFQLALPNGKWGNDTKFKRIYFYHARKAGGSSMHKYLASVARNYGIELKAVEWDGMEEPGTNEVDTFYVTHLREPVDRAISHFKYQGRWDCRDLVFRSSLNKRIQKRGRHGNFTPTEENANPIETWNQTGGHEPQSCRYIGKMKSHRFRLALCAVNCYSQWFSGLSCPTWNVSPMDQYAVAKARVLRFNMIVVIEKLRDPKYVEAVEQFFGVSGITAKGVPYCERESHAANAMYPVVIKNETRESLGRLNEIDIRLYHELSDCLNEDVVYNNFPKWDGERFALNSFNETKANLEMKKAKALKAVMKQQNNSMEGG
ncbi:hypothetical protein ACHAXS_003519 [Conticribra weissflogii]